MPPRTDESLQKRGAHTTVPANSVILSQIAGSTSGAPDGATFLDNLFGSGASAPTQRLFSLSLERREDVRTSSTLGIGAVSTSYCPTDTCKPNYLPITPQPSLGATGYLHWRLPLQGISATTWTNQADGTGATTSIIPLGSSQVDSGSSSPLAVLDSGGVAILVGYKQWTDQIYGKYNVKASADGLCEWIMPGKGDRRTYLQTDYLAPLKSLYPSPSAARTLPRTRWTCHGLTPPTQAKQHALAPSNTRPHSVRPATLCSARRSSRTSTPSFSIPTTSAVPNGSRLSVSSRLRTHPLHLRTSTPFGYNDSHSRMSRQTINRA